MTHKEKLVVAQAVEDAYMTLNIFRDTESEAIYRKAYLELDSLMRVLIPERTERWNLLEELQSDRLDSEPDY